MAALSKQCMRGPIQAQPGKGTSLLTAEDFTSPCTARAHVDPLFGSGRNCRYCYLLICVAAGAGLHLKTCKRSSWWLQQSDGTHFWKEAQLVSPRSRSSGAAFEGLAWGFPSEYPARWEQDRPGVNPDRDLTRGQKDARNGGWGRWESVLGMED